MVQPMWNNIKCQTPLSEHCCQHVGNATYSVATVRPHRARMSDKLLSQLILRKWNSNETTGMVMKINEWIDLLCRSADLKDRHLSKCLKYLSEIIFDNSWLYRFQIVCIFIIIIIPVRREQSWYIPARDEDPLRVAKANRWSGLRASRDWPIGFRILMPLRPTLGATVGLTDS